MGTIGSLGNILPINLLNFVQIPQSSSYSKIKLDVKIIYDSYRINIVIHEYLNGEVEASKYQQINALLTDGPNLLLWNILNYFKMLYIGGQSC